jgi:hypothetical protein
MRIFAWQNAWDMLNYVPLFGPNATSAEAVRDSTKSKTEVDLNAKNNVARVGRIASRVAKLVPAVSTLGGVGAIVALAPDANAAVIMSVAPANLNIPSTTAGIYINVITGLAATTPSGAPGWDINPWGSGSFFMWSAASGGIMTAPGGSTTLTGNLPIGTSVDGTGNFGTSNSSQFAGVGQFQLNATNYVGFRFLDEVDGLTHFGWASIILSGAANSQPRSVGQIWYEDQANTGILVGDTGTPEPSSAALLALGAAGLLAVRRRRQRS